MIQTEEKRGIRLDFSRRLKAARISAGYRSMKAFAEALGVEDETYRRWERGETEPGLARLRRISKMTSISLDILVSGGHEADGRILADPGLRPEPVGEADGSLRDVLLKALGGVYKEMPIGLCYFDTQLRYVHINDWLAALNGMSVEQHLGRTIGEIIPQIASGVEAQLRHVIENGEPIFGGAVDAETPAQPGIIRRFRHNFHPVTDGGGTVVGVSCYVDELLPQPPERSDRTRAPLVVQTR